MEDCIVISDDDEEVEVLEQYMTCEPIVIDLTDSQIESQPPSQPTQPPREPSQPLSPQPPPSQIPPQPPPPQSPAQSPPPQIPTKPPPPQNPTKPQSQPIEKPNQLSEQELMLAKKELGNKRYRTNQLNEAVRLYREAGDLARKLDDKELQAILHFNLAMTYSRLGSYNQAADECAAAVKIDNNYMKAHCKRAEIYMSLGKYDEAVICYEYICELDSTKREEAMKRIIFAREMSRRSRKLDQYEILGLQPNFTIEELRKTYRKIARIHHPDRHSDTDVVTRRIHEKIFKEASEAYAFFQKRYGFQ